MPLLKAISNVKATRTSGKSLARENDIVSFRLWLGSGIASAYWGGKPTEPGENRFSASFWAT